MVDFGWVVTSAIFFFVIGFCFGVDRTMKILKANGRLK